MMVMEKDVLVYEPGTKVDVKTTSKCPMTDQSEESAQAYLRHKDCGNVDKARQLGKRLAEMLVEDIPDIENGNSEDWLLIDHLKMMYIFVAEQCIKECPDAILYQVSLSAFREAIEKGVPGAYDAMSGCSADTFYQLAYYRKCSQKIAHEMGETMAELCGRAGDWKVIALAEHFFNLFRTNCREECEKTKYVL